MLRDSVKSFVMTLGDFFVQKSEPGGLLVRSPGFEPGSSTWQADVLNQTRLRPLASSFYTLIQRGDVIFLSCWLRVLDAGLNQHRRLLFKFSEKANSILV